MSDRLTLLFQVTQSGDHLSIASPPASLLEAGHGENKSCMRRAQNDSSLPPRPASGRGDGGEGYVGGCPFAAKTIGLLRLLLVLVIVFTVTGCGLGPETSEYGSVMFPTKSSSINGLGVFEQLCKQAGSKCIVANRLSSRLEKVDAIILVGNSFHPPAKEARDWLEEWLAGEPGRSVVYFGRDFDAELYYRQQTLDQVPAESRNRAMFELMNARSRLDTMLLEQVAHDAFCRWFTLRIHEPRREIKQYRGPWSDVLAGESGTWPVRVLLEPPAAAQRADKPKWPAAKTGTTPPLKVGSPAASSTPDDEPVVFTSQWNQWDIGDDETWESEWEKVPETEVLLAGGDGTPLVTRLTSERYPGSQILTVVNGAPFLNGTLVEPHFRKVAHKLIGDLQPAKRIALLPFTEYGILVSRLAEEENELAGLSVLTTWPMNIIVAHLAFLGILICLALFPILGRPQKLQSRSLADFGQHAESLGQMLQRTGDLSFALRTIADYYRTVRSETVPGWVESALQQTSSASPTASASGSASPPNADAIADSASGSPATAWPVEGAASATAVMETTPTATTPTWTAPTATAPSAVSAIETPTAKMPASSSSDIAAAGSPPPAPPAPPSARAGSDTDPSA